MGAWLLLFPKAALVEGCECAPSTCPPAPKAGRGRGPAFLEEHPLKEMI